MSSVRHQGYGAGVGTVDTYEYKCLCGEGYVAHVKDNIPGFKESDIFIKCKECSRKYDAKSINGEVHLVEKD